MSAPWITLVRFPVMADAEDSWAIRFGGRLMHCQNEDDARKLFRMLQANAPNSCDPEIQIIDLGEM